MTTALLGTKIGMTSILGEKGRVEPVTVIKAGPCVVLQVKQEKPDGYDAIQIGFGDVKPHRSTRAMIGHAGRADTGPKRYVREVRLSEPATVARGEVLTVESFASESITLVDVTGTTKGKGFAGVMKRHNFGGKEATHGVERKHRSAGSIGGHSSLGTGRGVKKGKRMAGHMGNVRCTISGMRLLKVDVENGLLLIRGSVPGANGTCVLVRKATKSN